MEDLVELIEREGDEIALIMFAGKRIVVSRVNTFFLLDQSESASDMIDSRLRILVSNFHIKIVIHKQVIGEI